jgi:hypothetical protein
LLPDDLKLVLSAEVHLLFIVSLLCISRRKSDEEQGFVVTCLTGLGRNFFQRTGNLIFRKLRSIIP